jgi:hypothetical protein
MARRARSWNSLSGVNHRPLRGWAGPLIGWTKTRSLSVGAGLKDAELDWRRGAPGHHQRRGGQNQKALYVPIESHMRSLEEVGFILSSVLIYHVAPKVAMNVK